MRTIGYFILFLIPFLSFAQEVKVVDKETQEKIDVVKSRLIKNHGYCEICATDALNFVASIFAKGDSAKS